MCSTNAMANLRTIATSKCFVALLLMVSVVWLLYPFVNGLGCSYRFTHDGELNLQKGKCRSGVLSVYIENKASGRVINKTMLWGKRGSEIYTLFISQREVKPAVATDNQALYADTFYDNQLLIVGLLLKTKQPNQYISVFDYPFDIGYDITLFGKTSFLY